MDNPIAVGDLVVVVIGALCCGAGLGVIYKVTAIKDSKYCRNMWRCSSCGAEGTSEFAWSFADPLGYSLRCLKRIPPLEELEGERTEEKLRVPA